MVSNRERILQLFQQCLDEHPWLDDFRYYTFDFRLWGNHDGAPEEFTVPGEARKPSRDRRRLRVVE